MAEPRLHAMRRERSVAERFFWLWLLLAFLIGSLPGLGLWWYQRTVSNARTERLTARVTADSAKLTAQDKEFAKLRSEVTSSQAALSSGSGSAASGGGAASSESSGAPPDVSAPPAGTVRFVSRTITPSPATAGATLNAVVVVAGDATDAYIQLKSAEGSYSKIWRLKPGAKSGATQEWTRDDATAPKTKGDYTVFAWAFVGSKRFVMKPAGSLTVK